MPLYNLFPLSILKEKILLNQNIKNEMIETIDKMYSNSKNISYKNNQSSWTGDTQGFEYLLKDKKFNFLLNEVKKKLIEYIKYLGINDNSIQFYLTRSWATISNGKEEITKHKHKQSHISFAYYLKKKETDSNIVFFDESYQNEIIPGIFVNPTVKRQKVLHQSNFLNAPSIHVDVHEDDIVIFPSKALHGTEPDKINDKRISISGDIVCVAKDSKLLENIMPPLENWDKI